LYFFRLTGDYLSSFFKSFLSFADTTMKVYGYLQIWRVVQVGPVTDPGLIACAAPKGAGGRGVCH
jgi:hypothetical protein